MCTVPLSLLFGAYISDTIVQLEQGCQEMHCGAAIRVCLLRPKFLFLYSSTGLFCTLDF
jgi:hypothetical protein